MDNDAGKTIAEKITRVFIIGSALLLLCYWLLFKMIILVTEEKNNMRRLELIAPFYFTQYDNGKQGTIIINPLLTSYDQYHLLPKKIKQVIGPQWIGQESLHFGEDDSELGIIARDIGGRQYYLVENVDVIEWSDNTFILIQISLFICGIILFLIASLTIKNSAKKIAQPFSRLAKQLSTDNAEDFEKLSIDGVPTIEFKQTLSAINNYREKIACSIEREQSFTRYVSHELRTPMTIIKGGVSVLRKQQTKSIEKQCLRINSAVDEMQALTQTFLLLARGEHVSETELIINNDFLEKQLADLISYSDNSQCTVRAQVLGEVVLKAEPVLFTTLLKNLLINAINCSPNGRVSLFVDQQQLSVIDDGIGLEHNQRGYEGFGIGLVLVKDICDKYHWSFSLKDNSNKGCCAQVLF